MHSNTIGNALLAVVVFASSALWSAIPASAENDDLMIVEYLGFGDVKIYDNAGVLVNRVPPDQLDLPAPILGEIDNSKYYKINDNIFVRARDFRINQETAVVDICDGKPITGRKDHSQNGIRATGERRCP